jgi:hypothetical protein
MNRLTRILPIVMWAAAGAALAAGMPCSVHPPEGTAKAELAKLAKVSQADAERTAKATLKDASDVAVAEVELEAEHGCLVWSFDLKVKGNDGVYEVMIDAGDGQVLSSAHESPAKEAAEKKSDQKKAPTPRH